MGLVDLMAELEELEKRRAKVLKFIVEERRWACVRQQDLGLSTREVQNFERGFAPLTKEIKRAYITATNRNV